MSLFDKKTTDSYDYVGGGDAGGDLFGFLLTIATLGGLAYGGYTYYQQGKAPVADVQTVKTSAVSVRPNAKAAQHKSRDAKIG